MCDCRARTPGEEDSELSPKGDGLEQRSDTVRFESDQDGSDSCMLGGVDQRGHLLFGGGGG